MYTFLLHLSAMLVLAEGGAKVRANERRQAIWHSLCRHRQMTMNDLVAEYKTCRATILRDISVLSLSYPIVTIRGNGGGVKLADWYEPGKQKLTPAQTDLLLRLSSTLTGADAHIMHSILSQYADPTHKRKLNLDK